MKKRLLAILLTASVLLTLLPDAVLADDPGTGSAAAETTAEETTDTEHTEHSYTSTKVGPTCTDCTHIQYTCACGDTYTEAVPSGETVEEATGHHFVKESGSEWICSVCGETASAEEINNYSVNMYAYDLHGAIVKSYLVETADGKLLTVWSSGGCVLNVDTRDFAGNLEGSRQLVLDYPIFGGFFDGADAYYVACGEDNYEQDNSRAVIRIIKYSKDWVRMDAVTLYGGNTTIPFRSGSLRMTETDGTLYIYSSHQMYQTADGKRHQANLTMVVNEDSMSGSACVGIYSIKNGYVSHSFNQFVKTDGDDVYRADLGDAYPRAICLTKCSVGGSFTNCSYCNTYDILGETGDNATGVSVGGMELSTDNVLIVGNSVEMEDSSDYDPDSLMRNIMLTVTDKNLSSTKVIWLTEYTDDSSEKIWVGTPFLVKLSDDRFMVLWEEIDYNNLESILLKVAWVDGSGKLLGKETLEDCWLSDCQPVLTSDGNVTWFGQCGDAREATVHRISKHCTGSSEVIRAATCSTDGLRRGTCTICGESFDESIPATGAHTWDAGTVTTAATCTTDGVKTYTCTACGQTKTEVIQKLGHSWDAGTVTTPAQATTDGVKTYTCTRCGATKTEVIPATGGPTSPFSDVQNTDDYYYEPVLWAAENGIVYGVDDTHFAPNATCTRAQVVTFLYRAAGEPAVRGSNPFRDVGSGEYYYDAVLWGFQNGIVYGTSDTTFSPNATVTRAQFITFLYRFALEPEVTDRTSPFADLPADAYYTDAVLWGYHNSIVYGVDDNHFAPNATCTRAQVVTFLHRYMTE